MLSCVLGIQALLLHNSKHQLYHTGPEIKMVSLNTIKVVLYGYIEIMAMESGDLYLRIECILLKFHWGMKVLTEVHFQ